MPATEPVDPFDPSTSWALHPQVALRPEPFGALAYHFGTRRLSFLKSPTLVRVVERLAHEPNATAACRAVGVGAAEWPRYEQALAALAASGMIRRQDQVPADRAVEPASPGAASETGGGSR